MPPYTPNTSQAQQRKMFALAERGDISMDDAKGKARASEYSKLPSHVKHAALKGLHHSTHKRR